MTEQDLQLPLLLPVDSTPAFQVMCRADDSCTACLGAAAHFLRCVYLYFKLLAVLAVSLVTKGYTYFYAVIYNMAVGRG